MSTQASDSKESLFAWAAFLLVCLASVSDAGASAYYNRVMFARSASAGCATIARVQSVPSAAGSYVRRNRSQAETITVGAGNFLVAVAYGYSSFGGFSVSDSLANVWSAGPLQASPDGSTHLQIFYAPIIHAGTTTVSVNQYYGNSDVYTGLSLIEYSGVAPTMSALVGQGAAASVYGSTASIGSLSPASGCGELAVAALSTGSAAFLAPGSGWTTETQDGFAASLVEDKILPAAAAFSATATMNATTNDWFGVELIFRAQGSLPPAQPTRLAITTSPQTLGATWQCSGALTVEARNSSNQPVTAPLPIALNVSGGGLALFIDPNCSFPAMSPQIFAGTSSRTFYFAGATTGSQTLTMSASGLSSANQSESITAVSSFVWIGGASCDGSWSNSACWSGGVAPGVSDIAQFDSGCTTHCSATLTADASLDGLVLHAGFLGSVSLNGHALSIGATGMSAGGGGFDSGSGTLSVDGNLVILGAAVNFAGDVVIGSGYGMLSGTLNTAGSTLHFKIGDNCNFFAEFAPGAASYNNVSFEDYNGCGAPGIRSFELGSTMNVAGTLTFASTGVPAALVNGTIRAYGDVVSKNMGYIDHDTSATVVISGTGNQLLTGIGSQANLPSIVIAKPAGILSVQGNPTMSSNLTYVSGTVDYLSASSSVTFSKAYCDLNEEVDIVPGPYPFNNVKVIDSVESWCLVRRRITDGGTLTVNGTLTLGAQSSPKAWLYGGTIAAKGAVVVQDLGYRGGPTGPTELRISGGSNQTINAVGPTALVPSFSLASTGGGVTFLGNLQIDTNYSYVSGSADFSDINAKLTFIYDSCDSGDWRLSPGPIVYGAVTFADAPNCSQYVARNLDAGSTMKVSGPLVLGSTLNAAYLVGGTIAASGNITLQGVGYFGTTQIAAAGTLPQIFDVTAASQPLLPALTFASSGGVTFFGNPQVTDNLTYVSGTADFLTHSSTLVLNDPRCASHSSTIDPGPINYYNVSISDANTCANASRTLSPASTMHVQGNLAIAPAATLFLSGGSFAVAGNVNIQGSGVNTSSNFQIGGNLTGVTSGVLTASAGKVQFTAGANHSITGAHKFFDFTFDNSSVTTANTLTFPAGKTQKIDDLLSLAGNSTQKLSVVSSTPGTAAILDVAAGQTMGGYLSIQDNVPSSNSIHTGLFSTLVSDFGTTTPWISP